MSQIVIRLTVDTRTGRIVDVHAETKAPARSAALSGKRRAGASFATLEKFYKANPRMSRLDMLDVFMSQFGLDTDAARASYLKLHGAPRKRSAR